MKLFAQKDAEAFAKTGATEFRYSRDIRLTPGAKDIFSEAGIKVVFDAGATAGTTDDQKHFNSPGAERIKKRSAISGAGSGRASIATATAEISVPGSARIASSSRRPA